MYISPASSFILPSSNSIFSLVLSASGHVKLTDFGFAKSLEDSGRAFTLCGTPEYLAPEIIRGTGYGHAVDWWALGVLLFEMLSGYSPFYSASPLEIYKNILSGRIRFPSVINPVAKDLLKGLLSRDPRKRLGVVRNGVSGLRQHPFFNGVHWNSTMQPPIVPSLACDGDTKYFKLEDESDGDGDGDGAGTTTEDGDEKEVAARFPDF
jgi:serine/threonine protein kinase